MTGEFAAAVHALVFLNHKNRTLSSDELAENVCTNPARIRKIMSKLKKAGLVQTKEGAEGGYSFDREPEEVHLGMICDALGIVVVSSNWSSGSEEMECQVASGMAAVMEGIYSAMNRLCREYLESITIEIIDRQIFKRESAESETDVRKDGE